MTQKEIIQELNELESNLSAGIPHPYTVPEGYFEGFASQILNHIKALNANSAKEELAYLSPTLAKLSKELPYKAPAGYFDKLGNNIAEKLHEHALIENISPKEELQSISPLLNSIDKKIPYTIPEGYFETFKVNVATEEKEPAKVIAIGNGSRNKWLRYAAAAVIAGLLVLSGILFLKPDVTNDKAAYDLVKKSLKQVSTDDINNFIQETNKMPLSDQAIAAGSQSSIRDLLKDISDKDLQKFLNETDISEESIDDLFLN